MQNRCSSHRGGQYTSPPDPLTPSQLLSRHTSWSSCSTEYECTAQHREISHTHKHTPKHTRARAHTHTHIQNLITKTKILYLYYVSLHRTKTPLTCLSRVDRCSSSSEPARDGQESGIPTTLSKTFELKSLFVDIGAVSSQDVPL